MIYILAYLLGLRHGIDWDHIAAITDVTGTSKGKKEGFRLGLFYIFGHATVIVTLGLLAVAIGINLPEWVDPFMEKFVGVTLVLLGAWLLLTIIKYGKNFKLKSRWMLIMDGVEKISNYIHSKIPHRHEHLEIKEHKKNASAAAFIVGVIHGIGAETPTQVLLFVTAAGVGKGLFGIIVLFIFVSGLITSNTFISILSVIGYTKAKNNSKIYVGLGLVTATFSLVIGSLFLLNKGSILPAIIGG